VIDRFLASSGICTRLQRNSEADLNDLRLYRAVQQRILGMVFFRAECEKGGTICPFWALGFKEACSNMPVTSRRDIKLGVRYLLLPAYYAVDVHHLNKADSSCLYLFVIEKTLIKAVEGDSRH
jgi:hypothetical protein